MSDRKPVPFHGIISVGNSKDEAINRYKLAAVGKGVSAFADRNRSLSFVTNSNSLSDMFNPLTGDLDLEELPEMVDNLEFESQSSEEGREVNYYECRSGCGAHVVYDSEDLLKFCPVCTSAVVEAGEDESESGEDESEDDSDEDDSDEDESDEDGEDDSGSEDGEDEDGASESSDDEDEDEDDSDSESDEGEDDSESDEDGEDESDGEDDSESDEDDAAEPVVVAASSKNEAISMYQAERAGVIHASAVEVNYMVCSSSACGAHVIFEGDDLKSCPVCTASLQEAESDPEQCEHVVNDLDDASEESDDSSEPLTVAASSKAEAIAMYQAERAGVIHASAVEVNYMVCSSSDCGAHILCEGDELAACPVCHSAVLDPEDEDESDLEVMPVEDEDEDEDGDEMEDDVSESSDELEDEGNVVEIDALQNLDDSDEDAHAKLDVVHASNVGGAPIWTAYYAGQPVAIARKSESKHQDIFDDSSFGRAVIASAKHAGVVNTLREMGFKSLSHQVNLERYTEQQLEAALASERSALEQEQKQHRERLMAALATASIGLTRGFFVGQTNPLKDALFNALSSAGVRNPDVILHKAFKAASDPYHNVLFAKASDIMSKPSEVQEGLARAVLEMNHLSTSSDTGSSVEERLASLGTPAHVSPEKPAEVSTSSSDGGFASKAAAVVSSLGRRR